MIFPLLLYPGVGSAPCKGDEILPLSLSQPGTISGTNQGQNHIGLHRWRPRPRRSKLGAVLEIKAAREAAPSLNRARITATWRRMASQLPAGGPPSIRRGGILAASGRRTGHRLQPYPFPRRPAPNAPSARWQFRPTDRWAPRRPPARRNYWSVALGSYP